jgi:hypothetical protein
MFGEPYAVIFLKKRQGAAERRELAARSHRFSVGPDPTRRR